ncbi:MAG: hypothetical protein KDK78_11055 [Chlamydiia bacterium]|nr:hypothetical protein [Chlamydiia bacterium]
MPESSPFDLFSGGGSKRPKDGKKDDPSPKSEPTKEKRKKDPAWRAGPRSRDSLPIIAELENATLSDPELEYMYQQVRGAVMKIRAAVKESCEKNEITREALLAYLDSPENICEQDPEEVEALKSYLQLRRSKTVTAAPSSRPVRKKRSDGGGDRKGKTLGGRKGWIPMG